MGSGHFLAVASGYSMLQWQLLYARCCILSFFFWAYWEWCQLWPAKKCFVAPLGRGQVCRLALPLFTFGGWHPPCVDWLVGCLRIGLVGAGGGGGGEGGSKYLSPFFLAFLNSPSNYEYDKYTHALSNPCPAHQDNKTGHTD